MIITAILILGIAVKVMVNLIREIFLVYFCLLPGALLWISIKTAGAQYTTEEKMNGICTAQIGMKSDLVLDAYLLH